MARIKLKYWVAMMDYDFEIVIKEPDPGLGWKAEGPFYTLERAKRIARAWIATDREALAHELKKISRLKYQDFEEAPAWK